MRATRAARAHVLSLKVLALICSSERAGLHNNLCKVGAAVEKCQHFPLKPVTLAWLVAADFGGRLAISLRAAQMARGIAPPVWPRFPTLSRVPPPPFGRT